MLTEREIELAHPDAFDFAFGNLPEVKQAEFTRHLGSCPHCQKVLDEYSDIGRIIKNLPPHVEPPADLEDRTVAAMVENACRTEGQDRSPLRRRRPSRHPDLPDSRGCGCRKPTRPGDIRESRPRRDRAAGPGTDPDPRCCRAVAVAALPGSGRGAARWVL